jgi:hypothetical protein
MGFRTSFNARSISVLHKITKKAVVMENKKIFELLIESQQAAWDGAGEGLDGEKIWIAG